jgi:hypothetical protein
VIAYLKRSGTRHFIIQTGQINYLDILNEGIVGKKKADNTGVDAILVPSRLCEEMQKAAFPDGVFKVAGNLRYDSQWIEEIRTVQKNAQKKESLNPLPALPQGKIKVAFMLSKMSYGVDESAIRQSINHIGALDEVACAVKPHTRGMKYKTRRGDSQVFNAARHSSTQLIEWADIVLFTGSGIAFQALALGKAVGFLAYCQKMKSIFDDGKTAIVFDSPEQLYEFIETAKRKSLEDAFSKVGRKKAFNEIVQNGARNGIVTDAYINILNSLLDKKV